VIADATSRTLPIIYVNPAFEQITGYSAGEVLGKHWRFLEDIEPNPKELEKLSIALREEINCTVTLRNARKDGTIFWNEFSVSPIYDRYGALTHFLGVQNDITASKEAQAKVQATKEQLQAVLDAVPGFVSWTGDDLNYLGVNRKLAEHFELHQDDFVDQPLDFVEGREPFADFITAFMAQPNLSTAQAIINSTRNGMINHYLLVSQKYNDDRSVVSVGIDITERKIVEEKLQATTTRLRSLIENLQVGILAQDHEQKVVLINETFCHLFNIESKANTLLGQDFRDFATNYQHLFADREWFQRQYEDALEQQQIISDRELALTDGRTLQMDYVPIVHDERFQGHLWMYRDISDRKLAQRKLLASLQEKEVLLKEIHHRVKNNLYVISGLLNLQSQQFSDPEICSFFNDSKNRIQTMAMIHEQLYQSGDLAQIHFEAYVQSLVRNLLVSYNPDPDNIKTEFKLKHIPIDLDMAISCGLLINELVTNSFKHAFEKGKPGKLLVEFEQLEASTLILKIADTGKGLPQDLDWEEATSLGLKLVRILTDQLDGTMELESSSAGTCFTLYFPLDNS
jgi:PAS domain S-box-containing protein